MISYSRVDTWKQCPYKYSLRYLRVLETIPNSSADDALLLGTAFHTALERGIVSAEQEFYANFPIITDDHVSEMLKLEITVSEAERLLSKFKGNRTYELHVTYGDVQAFIDCLIENDDGTYTILDFKYAKDSERYKKSAQLPLYRFLVEESMGIRVSYCAYLVAEKIRIRQKSNETVEQYRLRIREQEPKAYLVEPESFDIVGFLKEADKMQKSTEFPKVISGLCRFCEYQRFCGSNENDLTEIQI